MLKRLSAIALFLSCQWTASASQPHDMFAGAIEKLGSGAQTAARGTGHALVYVKDSSVEGAQVAGTASRTAGKKIAEGTEKSAKATTGYASETGHKTARFLRLSK